MPEKIHTFDEAPTSLAPEVSQVEMEETAPTFAELGVPGPLVHVLKGEGKKTAFPIQQDTLPDSLQGRDILGRGRTGSGKTLAFAIPLIARLGEANYDETIDNKQQSMTEFRNTVKRIQKRHERERSHRDFLPHPRGLVLAPTRELANQISEVITPLANMYGMETTTVYGGVRYQKQIHELRDGADIVVACPGRLEDLLQQGVLTLDDVQVVVLDEADEMADMGFLPPIKRLLEQIDEHAQHMLFSATLDHGVDEVVNTFLHNPKVHSVDDVTSPVDLMTHHLFLVSKNDKNELVRVLASGKGRRILFTRTKFQAKKLAKFLTQHGIPAAELHGNLNQNQRDRNLQAFESGEVNVMVATDVAARGIDVSGVALVIQVDPPDNEKSFTHRSGRTARAGHAGDVVSIITPDQRRYARGMMRRAGIKIKPLEVTPQSPQVLELVGEQAELVEGWELPPLERKHGGKSRSRRPRNRNRNTDHEPRFSRNSKTRKKQEKNGRKSKDSRKPAQLNQEEREFASMFLGDVDAVRAERKRHDDRHEERAERTNSRRSRSFKDDRRSDKRHSRSQDSRFVRDERDESVKRHERRMKARYGDPSSRKPKGRNHGKKRNAAPFRSAKQLRKSAKRS